MNVVLLLVSIFGLRFCQTIFDPIDEKEIGYFTGKQTPCIGVIKGLLDGKFHKYRKHPQIGITRLDFIIGL